MGEVFHRVKVALAENQAFALCTLVTGPVVGAKMFLQKDGEIVGSMGSAALDRAVANDAAGLLANGRTETRHYGLEGEARLSDVEVFIESFAPPARLIVFGAVDFTRSLSRIGKIMGYHVTVCDPRSVFATTTRFPEADEVVVSWPDDYLASTRIDERTVIAVLTHDPKLDVPALLAAVATPAAYIGAMGSRRTHAVRVKRLQSAGMSEADIARIAAPIGLDIGAATPEEAAISVFAEIVALRSGREGGRLTGGSGSIHA